MKIKAIFAAVLMMAVFQHPASAFTDNVEPVKTYSMSEISDDINVFGHVVDKTTGDHIPGALVYIPSTGHRVLTDRTGHYFMNNVPSGKVTVIMECLGYRTIQHEIQLVDNKSFEVNFETGEDALELNSVVVSANRAESNRMTAPALVNVLDTRLLTKVQANCLAEGLSFQPGVRVENNCQNCGFKQVRINGMEGPYTQILLDSRAIFSSLSGVYGLEQIPASMIDRIEVMRGGGSALFGSSAIAGVVNIITKEPLYNTLNITHTTAVTDNGSADFNTGINAAYVSDDYLSGVYVFGQVREKNPYDRDGDGFSESSKIQQQTVGFRSYYKTSKYSRITAEYHHMHEYRRGGDQIDLEPQMALIAEEIEHSIDGGGLNFDWASQDYRHRLGVYSSAQYTARKSYYGTGYNPNAHGRTYDLTAVAGLQYNYTFNKLFFMPAELTIGGEYTHNSLADKMPGYDRDLRQKVNTGGIFLQNEWKNDMLSILIGVRMDKHSMVKHLVWSPRVSVRYNPVPQISIRAAYSEGYRAPQAYDEDLHVEVAGGDISIIEKDPDLKVEKSRGVSLSADFNYRFGEVATNFLVDGFYTNLRNVFVLVNEGQLADGTMIKKKQNGPGAMVAGANLEAKVAWHWLQFQAGATIQKSLYEEPLQWSEDPSVKSQKEMFRTPDVYGYVMASFNPVKSLDITLSGNYTGRMYAQHMAGYIENDRVERTPDFFDLNLKLGYAFKIFNASSLEVHGGVKNIFDSFQRDFDKGPDRDSGYIYGPMNPRMYYVGLSYKF